MKNYLVVAGILVIASFCSCSKDSEVDNNNEVKNGTLKDGLLAYYPFNGNINDESGNKYNLSGYGATPSTNRFNETGKAFSFDGIKQNLVIPSINADSVPECTISLWVKRASTITNTIISLPSINSNYCASRIGFQNFNNADDRLSSNMTTIVVPNNCTSISLVDSIENPLGKWCHIVLIQKFRMPTSSTRMAYFQYFNGQKVGFHETEYYIVQNRTSFIKGGVIGCMTRNFDMRTNYEHFKGDIDDVRIYNRAITDKEVAELYALRE
ncbi:MAG: LamG-like jellyroll fold domain-containing protein [Bacteroidota bacterium]